MIFQTPFSTTQMGKNGVNTKKILLDFWIGLRFQETKSQFVFAKETDRF